MVSTVLPARAKNLPLEEQHMNSLTREVDTVVKFFP